MAHILYFTYSLMMFLLVNVSISSLWHFFYDTIKAVARDGQRYVDFHLFSYFSYVRFLQSIGLQLLFA